jgi:hypothetical protein
MLICENVHRSISILKDDIKLIVEKYFRLSEAEKSISNEYEQAYKFASRRNDARLFQQAGRLSKNYINLLKNKYYIDKLDKESVTLAQLYSEADFLVSKLSNIDKQLAEDIKNIIKLYDELIKSDSDSRTAQDCIIADALKLAHAHASKTRLETIKYEIKQAIDQIKEVLEKKLETAVNFAYATLDPILHPRETLGNVLYCLRNPANSFKAISEWVKKHPCKAGLLLVNGLCVAFLSGFINVTIGLAIESALETTFADEIYVCGFTAYTSLLLLGGTGSVAGKVSKLVDESNDEIKKITEKEDEERNKINKEAEKISTQVRKAEYVRERMKLAQEQAEMNIRMSEEIAQTASNNKKKQLNQMNREELESTQSALQDYLTNIEDNSKENDTEIQQLQERFYQEEECNRKIREGRKAIEELIKLKAGNLTLA